MAQPKIIQVQKVPQKESKLKAEDLVARFCYHFPQYTYAQARRLPYKVVARLLNAAEREHAKHMYDLGIVIGSILSKDGAKKMLESFKDIAEGNN